MIRTETIFKRKNGKIIILIQIANKDVLSQKIEIDSFAKIIVNDKVQYVYPNDSFDKSLYGMSVEEYIIHGRKGLISILEYNEIIKARKNILSIINGEMHV